MDNPDSFIFMNTEGQRMAPETLSKRYDKVVSNAELLPVENEVFKLHDLRRMTQNEFIKANILHPTETHILLNQVGGHYEDGTLDHYLNPLLDKLDRHFLKVAQEIDRIVPDENGKSKTVKETIMVGMTLEEYARYKLGRRVTIVEIWQDNLDIQHTTRWMKARLHDWAARSNAKFDDRKANGKALVFQLQGELLDDLEYKPLGFMKFENIEDAFDIPVVSLMNMEDDDGILKMENYYFFSEARANEVLKDFPGGPAAIKDISEEEWEIVDKIMDILIHKDIKQPAHVSNYGEYQVPSG
jgi:hypothetical protein